MTSGVRRSRFVPAMLAVAIAAGCSAGRGVSIPAERALGGAVDDSAPRTLAAAARATVAALDAKDPRATVTAGGTTLTNADLARSARRVLEIASSTDDAAMLTARLERSCRAIPAGAAAKVTGYYEPVLAARRRADRRFRYPIYRQPSAEQLAAVTRRLGHVPSREDIDGRGALAGLHLELAFLDDAVARFFLHVQGSGRLVFDDGNATRVGFAGTNGLDYRSVGAEMLDQGILAPGAATAPAMRAWLVAHPERRDGLLNRNPRYVFFLDRGGDGPVGSLGATLVEGRSIAADPREVPPGAFAWLRTTRPVLDASGRVTEKLPLSRFVFAHDTGAAIQGPGRVDLFFGSGEKAGLAAGGMNESGELYLLVCDRPEPADLGWSPGPPRPVFAPRPTQR